MSQVTTDDVFDYFNAEVVPLLALKFAEAGEFYVEILNELRNAFTHLARAHALAKASPAEALEQSRLAKNHLRRASLDCLKVIVIIKAERVDHFIRDILAEYPLPKKIVQEAHNLRKERVRLASDETRGAVEATVTEMKTLFGQYDTLMDELQTEYGTYYHSQISAQRQRAVVKERWVFGLIGFFVAIFATIVFEAGRDELKKTHSAAHGQQGTPAPGVSPPDAAPEKH